MDKKEYYIDDRVQIPDNIKRMTKEERMKEIARLEAIVASEKKRISENRL